MLWISLQVNAKQRKAYFSLGINFDKMSLSTAQNPTSEVQGD